MLWKPASSAVYSAHFLMELFTEAGVPPGVINFVPGSGGEVGDPALNNPALAGVYNEYKAGQAAIVHAIASPYRERSHFDGQDVLENGGAQVGSLRDGWLNRCLQAGAPQSVSSFRAVSLTSNLPRILAGPSPALAIPDLDSFGVGRGRRSSSARLGLQALYRDADPLLADPANDLFA